MFKELFIESIEMDEGSANGYLLSLKTYIDDDRVKRDMSQSARYSKTKNDYYEHLNRAVLKAMTQDDGKLPDFVSKAADNAIRQKSRDMDNIINGSKLSTMFSKFAGKPGRSHSNKYL